MPRHGPQQRRNEFIGPMRQPMPVSRQHPAQITQQEDHRADPALLVGSRHFPSVRPKKMFATAFGVTATPIKTARLVPFCSLCVWRCTAAG
jgi:hypothetical protein